MKATIALSGGTALNDFVVHGVLSTSRVPIGSGKYNGNSETAYKQTARQPVAAENAAR